MRHISFRISDEDYEKLIKKLDCKPTSYFKKIAFDVMNGEEKRALTKLNPYGLYLDQTVQTCLTKEQRDELEIAAKKHGWTLSKEIRFRLQTTLSKNLDFFDNEMLEMRICRNQIKKIGLNINMILRRDEGRVLDQEGFKQDIADLKSQLSDLEGKFNYFIKKCTRRMVSCQG